MGNLFDVELCLRTANPDNFKCMVPDHNIVLYLAREDSEPQNMMM